MACMHVKQCSSWESHKLEFDYIVILEEGKPRFYSMPQAPRSKVVGVTINNPKMDGVRQVRTKREVHRDLSV